MLQFIFNISLVRWTDKREKDSVVLLLLDSVCEWLFSPSDQHCNSAKERQIIQNNKMVIDSAKMWHWQCLNRIPLSSIDNKHNNYPLAVVLAPLVEQLLPTQEICGLNPDIGKFYLPSTGKKI